MLEAESRLLTQLRRATASAAATRLLSTHSKLSPEQATSHVLVPLTHRCIIAVSGPDALKFLQGYTTNDTRALTSPHSAQFTAFLSGKGKTLADCLIAVDGGPSPAVSVGAGTPTGGAAVAGATGPRLLLDIHEKAKDDLLKHLKLYKLRAKVTVEDVSASHSVHAVLPFDPFAMAQGGRAASPYARHAPVLDVIRHALKDQPSLPAAASGCAAFLDPRSPSLLGLRVIAPRAADGVLDSLPLHRADQHEYEAVRMLAGVPEGEETRDLMPLEWNAAFLHCVSFDKGCYLGQELVARTHFRGLVRKRVMPVYLTGAGAPARPPACADPLAAATVRHTDEAMRQHVSRAGGVGHGQGHGPSSTHAVVDAHHSRIQHGGHAPSGTVEKGHMPRHRPAVRLPFPWLDRSWRGTAQVGEAVVAGDPGDKEGRPGRLLGWVPGSNLAMVMMRLDHVAHALPAAPRMEAGGSVENLNNSEGQAPPPPPPAAAASGASAASEGAEGAEEGEVETEEQRVAQYQRVHERARSASVDLHVGSGEGRHRVVPVLPEWWRHVRHAGVEETATRVAPG